MATEALQTRQQILDAAEDLIRRRGMGATTTRAIAELAGCAEGTIYRHFADKQTLVCEIVDAQFPEFRSLVSSLPGRAGTADISATLTALGTAALTFYRLVIPLVIVPLSDHEMLRQQRAHFRDANTGPLRSFQDVASYLRREQELGRLAAGASPEHAARLLLGSCFSQAFVEALVGEEASLGADADFVAATVGCLLGGIAA